MKTLIAHCSLLLFLLSPSFSGAALIPSSFQAASLSQQSLYKCSAQSAFSFSADGTKTAYELDGKIWVMQRDGSQKKTVADGTLPSFSYDGKQIAFQNEGSVQLYDIESQTARQISPQGAMPKFSPVRSVLVYKSMEDLSHNLVLYELDGEQSKSLTQLDQDARIIDFSWSPDGEWIVYNTQKFIPGGENVDASTTDIRVLNLSGSFHEVVIAAGEGGPSALSYQGKFLAYVIKKENAVCLWRVSLEVGASKLLECGDSVNGQDDLRPLKPDFSPDGHVLFPFFRAKENQFVIGWFNEDGAKIMDVARFPGPVRDVRWQAQGDGFGFLLSKATQPAWFALYVADFFPLYFNEEELSMPLPVLQQNESVLVPFKPVAQKVNADIVFHAQEKRVEVYHELSYSVLSLAKRDALVNGEKIALQSAPQVIGGMLYVPVDFLIKAFLLEAAFDESGQKLYLTYKEKKQK